jgi:hypothetical protein
MMGQVSLVPRMPGIQRLFILEKPRIRVTRGKSC